MNEVPMKIKTLLLESKFTYFCTVGAEFMPHVVPMFYLYNMENNKIYLMSTRASKKVDTLRTNNFVSLTVDVRNPVNPFLNYGVMVQGTARILDIKKHLRVVKMFVRKYPRFVRMERVGGRFLRVYHDVIIEVTPKLMTHWRGAHFTRWEAS